MERGAQRCCIIDTCIHRRRGTVAHAERKVRMVRRIPDEMAEKRRPRLSVATYAIAECSVPAAVDRSATRDVCTDRSIEAPICTAIVLIEAHVAAREAADVHISAKRNLPELGLRAEAIQ